jgi:hypothetical protein
MMHALVSYEIWVGVPLPHATDATAHFQHVCAFKMLIQNELHQSS